MKTATITWVLPSVRESGKPLDPDDILMTEVSLSADGGANFAVITDVVPEDDQSAVIPDLDTGDWIVRLVVEDKTNKRSDAVDTAFNIADETAPGTVTNVNVTLT